MSGPTTVTVGTTGTYTVSVTGGPTGANGLDVSVTSGTLVVTDSTNTKLLNGEITQTAAGTSQTIWSFDWIAPSTPGTVTMYAAGLSGDNDGKKDADDLWNLASLNIDVEEAPSPPDTEPPTVTISYPEDSTTLNIGTFTSTWTATDNVGVVNNKVYLNDVYQGETAGSSWDFVGLADGSYFLRIESYDAAGNMGNDTNSFTVSTADTEAPIVTITNPEDGAILDTGTFTATWTATDNVGVEYSEVYLDGVFQGSTAGYSWDFIDLPNGDYTLMIRSFDAAENWDSDSNSFSVSVPPPPRVSAELAGVGRKPGSIAPGNSMTFKARVKNTGTQNIQFYINFTIEDPSGYFVAWATTPTTDEPAGNGPSSATTSWSVPTNTLPGTYTVAATLYYRAAGATDWILGDALTITFKARQAM